MPNVKQSSNTTELIELNETVTAMVTSTLANLGEEALKKLLKQRRDTRKAIEANASIAALPPYTAPDDAADNLNYEVGLELAFRPGEKALLSDPALLTSLLYTPYIPHAKSKSYYGKDKFSMYSMFEKILPKVVKHLDAKIGGEEMSVCTDSELEFVSPIMTRMSQVAWYYTFIRNLVDGVGATVATSKENSGGGHLQFSPLGDVSEWNENEKYKVLLETCNRPWLTWVFNDPDDSSTARCPVYAVVHATWKASSDAESGSWWDELNLANDAVRFNSHKKDTLEFRLFGAPLDVNEQKLHVVFCDRFIKYALSQPGRLNKKKMPPINYLLPQELTAIKFDKAVKEFTALLTELGLNPADYQVFIDRNMKVRYEKGWLRN